MKHSFFALALTFLRQNSAAQRRTTTFFKNIVKKMASKEGYKTKEDKAHEKKMKKLKKDLVFFKVVNTLPDNTGGQERHETLKQTKAVLDEMKKEVQSTTERKETENAYMRIALTRLEEMKKEKERLEKISEDKERKNKAKK
jgi:hypothetical protein